MKKSRVVLLGILILMGVCLALALLGYLLYGAQRRRVMEGRPLVLIHAPLNRERIPLGEGIPTHATARATGGVARIELWVDGALLAVQESPGEGPVSPLVLASGWEPDILGLHVLVVRAFSSSDVAGQATITVEVVEAEEEEGPAQSHTVGEGETLETIAGEYGVGVEELEDLNPDLPAEGLQPGDRVQIPDEGGDASDDPAPEGAPEEPGLADETPPVPHVSAPGSLAAMIEILGMEGVVVTDNEPVHLRVEALALETDSEYESAHCYVSLGGGDPRWYPDPDGDQSTDDSFDSLGGGRWDVAAHLSDAAAPLISWPGNEPLPIDVTCEGMSGGGSNSVDLGRLELSVGRGAWDDITRRATSVPAEGFFTLDYRVSREEPLPIGPQPWIDDRLMPPTELRLIHAGAGYFLGWEYEPEWNDEPIDGFRIYLNDTLQWVEPPDEHFTDLPDQWVWPPCGERYEFTVSAFYNQDCPDCRESPESNAVTLFTGETGDPACGRRVYVDFETLITGNLGGDGGRDPGDMGPVYGTFYAGGQSASFDTEPGDAFEGLVHNGEYTINSDIARQELAQFRVYVPEGEDLVLAFTILDRDTGLGNEDDLVCIGVASVNVDVPSSGTIETSEPSDAPDDRCRVTYRVVPMSGPAVAAGEAPALPLLRVEGLTLGRDSGLLFIDVRNVGTADWARRDLTAAVERRSGAPIGVYTWPELDLEVGELAILSHPDLNHERPLDACVTLDPFNEVRDLNDRGAELGTVVGPLEQFCPPLPDLIITNVEYGEELDVLVITVENVGEADLDHRQIGLRIDLPDGSSLSAPAEWWPDVSIDRGRQKHMHWSDFQHLEMLRGDFTAVVDADDDIAEENEDNNTYEDAF